MGAALFFCLQILYLVDESRIHPGMQDFDRLCSAWHTATQNKRGYAHFTERGPDISGTDKNDCTAVKLAQEGKE